MKIEFYNIKNSNITPSIVVIYAKYKEKIIMCKHKERDTWEIPGGHIEKNETPKEAAERELYEETGEIDFKLKLVCKYSFYINEIKTYAMLYKADINTIKNLSESEIQCIELFEKITSNLTYPEIYKEIYKKVKSL